jgi:hypothetical protein
MSEGYGWLAAREFRKLKEKWMDKLEMMRQDLKGERNKVKRLEAELAAERARQRAEWEIAETKELREEVTALKIMLEVEKESQTRMMLLRNGYESVSKDLYREIVFHLHPDRWEGREAKARAEKCLAEFNALKTKLHL